MPTTLPDDLRTLPAEQRLALIDALWDSLDHAGMPVPADHLAELHRRLDAWQVGGADQRSWPELRAEMEQRLR